MLLKIWVEISGDAFGGIGPILLPMAIAGAGIIISIIGTMLVKISQLTMLKKLK